VQRSERLGRTGEPCRELTAGAARALPLATATAARLGEADHKRDHHHEAADHDAESLHPK
jgi:hypothetical protein